MKQIYGALILLLACSLVPFSSNAEKPGLVKVFKTRTGNPNIELTLVRLGERKEKRMLAYFKAPDFSINGEYNVYEGQCETTQCSTIFYKVIGGASTNFVSKSGYFGDYFELLVPEINKPLSLYYDEKLSSTVRNDDVYNQYLGSVGRNKTGSYNAEEVEKSLNSSLKSLQSACKSTVTINKNVDAFRKDKLIHLIGMAQYYMKEIASRCADEDYRVELAKIKTINVLPGGHSKTIEIKGSELFVFLSEATYNPRHEAKLWLESL